MGQYCVISRQGVVLSQEVLYWLHCHARTNEIRIEGKCWIRRQISCMLAANNTAEIIIQYSSIFFPGSYKIRKALF